MDWRSFFQPTKAKILVAALVYLFFAPVLQYCVYCFMGPCPGGCQQISLFEALFNLYPLNMNWLLALAGLPISYFAACALAAIYFKVKK